jgi:Protein of unknown function (DUF3467)
MANFPNPPVVIPNWAGPSEPGVTPTLYVNGIAILFSPWDFSLMFLRGLPAESPSEPSEHNFATTTRVVQSVVMSPQHAKAMLNALAHNIQAYEQQHGEIPIVQSTPREPDSFGDQSSESGDA